MNRNGNVNAFMNEYPDRMEPNGPHRNINIKEKLNVDVDMYKKVSPFIQDLFPGNQEVAGCFNILKHDYGFTSDMLWRIAEKMKELKKQGSL